MFLAEVGFAVAFGVLLDTIVVRSILVPALGYDIGKVIWWPSKLRPRRLTPPARRSSRIPARCRPTGRSVRGRGGHEVVQGAGRAAQLGPRVVGPDDGDERAGRELLAHPGPQLVVAVVGQAHRQLVQPRVVPDDHGLVDVVGQLAHPLPQRLRAGP